MEPENSWLDRPLHGHHPWRALRTRQVNRGQCLFLYGISFTLLGENRQRNKERAKRRCGYCEPDDGSSGCQRKKASAEGGDGHLFRNMATHTHIHLLFESDDVHSDYSTDLLTDYRVNTNSGESCVATPSRSFKRLGARSIRLLGLDKSSYIQRIREGEMNAKCAESSAYSTQCCHKQSMNASYKVHEYQSLQCLLMPRTYRKSPALLNHVKFPYRIICIRLALVYPT